MRDAARELGDFLLAEKAKGKLPPRIIAEAVASALSLREFEVESARIRKDAKTLGFEIQSRLKMMPPGEFLDWLRIRIRRLQYQQHFTHGEGI